MDLIKTEYDWEVDVNLHIPVSTEGSDKSPKQE